MASMIDACVANMRQSLQHVATDVNTTRSDFDATMCSMETVGDRLKRARQKRFTSARQAAIANGWAESTVTAHENGSRGFGRTPEEAVATAKKYARAYGVDFRSILYEEAEAKRVPAEVDVLSQRFSDLDEGERLIIGRMIEAYIAQKLVR